MSWFPFIAISVKQWCLTQTKSQWMTGSNCKTIGIFDSCSWQWMQGLLWHLPEPFSWEISENNNCQLHTGKQLKAAGVSMLTRKGFVNKHLQWFLSHHNVFCSWAPHFLSNRQYWHKRSKAGRRGIKCQQKLGLSLCQLFPQKTLLRVFWSYTAKFKLQVIQDVFKGQQKYVFPVVFFRQPKINRYELSYNWFQMCLWCDCWLFKIATHSNFHLRVLNVKHWWLDLAK